MTTPRRAATAGPAPEGVVDTAVGPDGSEMTLHHRDGRWQIRIDGRQLVDSAQSDSEKVLAVTALAAMRPSERPRILVGGLGMGFTLRAVLANLPPGGRVAMVEALPAVVAWNRGAIGELCGRPLDDPRVGVVPADVVEVLAAAREEFDAVILDVDNGPADLTLAANRRLYDDAGAAALARALRPGGAATTWSSMPARDYESRLAAAGLSVGSACVPLAGGRTHHFVILAVKPVA